MRKVTVCLTAAALVLHVATAFAGEPVDNIDRSTHPNLAKAQMLARQAYDKVVAAQKANEGDMEGHAQKAKQLLDEVNVELKAAAQFSRGVHGK